MSKISSLSEFYLAEARYSHLPRVQVTLERQHNGSLRASAVYNNRLHSLVFYGCTMREARAMFLEHLETGDISLVS